MALSSSLLIEAAPFSLDLARCMDKLRLIVDHDDPAVRTAFIGVLSALLKAEGIDAKIKCFEKTQYPSEQAVTSFKELAEATANMINDGNLELIITEQVEIPDVMRSDMTMSAIDSLAEKGGIGDLQTHGADLLDEIGLSLKRIRQLLEETRQEMIQKHAALGHTKVTDDIAAEICALSKEKITKYVESVVALDKCPISVETLSRPLDSGEGYEFALALSVDNKKLEEYKRGKDQD